MVTSSKIAGMVGVCTSGQTVPLSQELSTWIVRRGMGSRNLQMGIRLRYLIDKKNSAEN